MTKPNSSPKPRTTARRKRASRAGRTPPSERPAKRVDDIAPREDRAVVVLRKLRKLYPDADCALHHRSAFELVIATILSAQSTDVNVNKVTPALFGHYPTAKELAAADLQDVEEIIRSTGFFRQKAKNIVACARKLISDFGGEVPQTINELITLPGVARKTANVVLGTWFGKNEGVVVDTHVGRIAQRLDLSWSGKDSKDAVKIEQDLMKVLPRKDWTFFSHAVIWLGRETCVARRPRCHECRLAPDCPTAGEGEAS